MKTIKVEWTEREIIQYHYGEEIEVDDDFEVDINSISGEISLRMFHSIDTSYVDIKDFTNDKGVLEIKKFEIESYEEVLPPSPEEKKAEYQQMLIEIQRREDEIKQEKENIIKLLTQ